MKFAQIKNGIVESVIVLEDESLAPAFGQNFDQILNVTNANPQPSAGWTYDGQTFTQPPSVEVFHDLTPRQIRIALLLNGITDGMIKNSFATLQEPTRSLAEITWEFALTFERHHPLIVDVASQLGWTEEDVNELWRQASTL